MPLPRRDALADWPDEIADAAESEMRAYVHFLTPQPSILYDADTDTGGPQPSLLLFQTKARVQELGAPGEFTSGSQPGKETRFRVQFPLREWRNLIPKGTVITIVDGGRDIALQDITLYVNSAIGSSNAALRSVEASSELAPTPAA